MGRSVNDVAHLLSALVEPDKTTVPEGGYISAPAMYQNKTFRVGTLDPQIWNYPDFLVKPNFEATKQMVSNHHVYLTCTIDKGNRMKSSWMRTQKYVTSSRVFFTIMFPFLQSQDSCLKESIRFILLGVCAFIS